MTGRPVDQVLSDNLRAEAEEMRPAERLDQILGPGRERERIREFALASFSDAELRAYGRAAVERIENLAGAADCRPAAPESPTTPRRSTGHG